VRRASLLLAALALLGGCSGDGDGAISEGKLPELVLQPDDLPRVWSQFDEGRQGLADAPAGRRADPARFGRKGGWKARYRRAGSVRTQGPLVIESRADLFADADGARRDLDALEDDLEASLGGSSKHVEADIGEEAVAASALQGTGRRAVRFYSVAWRQDNVVAAMLVNGFASSLTLEEVLRLARRQEERIARAREG
jgi:hypothetical protein